MIDLIFTFFSTYLIEVMTGLLLAGLLFRFAAFKQSKREDSYFTTFTGELEKILIQHKSDQMIVDNVDHYIADLLEEVSDKLPKRSVRSKKKKKAKGMAEQVGARNVVSLREYVSGDRALFLSIKNETAAFKANFPPNFTELTDRILEQDDEWNKLSGLIPVAPIARLNDIMPGLFVVFGIFGTFIGISMALPEIANIDFNNLDGSGDILTRFVLNVTYAMKTSIAGILFSLVMTFINTIAPVRGSRQKTFKKLANCFENIWYTIHGKQSADDVMPLMLEELKALRQELRESREQDKKSA